jgi:hypothetical protein
MTPATTIDRVLAHVLANSRLFRDLDTSDGYVRLMRYMFKRGLNPREELSASRAIDVAHAMHVLGIDEVDGFVFPYYSRKTPAQRALAFSLVTTVEPSLCPRCGGDGHGAALCGAEQTAEWACGVPLWGGDMAGAW